MSGERKPRLRFKEFEGEWGEKTIGGCTLFIKDGTHGSFKDSSSGYPLLSAKDIYNGKINIPNDCRIISKEDYASIYNNYNLQLNDILLTIVGTIGRVAIVKTEVPNVAFQRSVAILRPTESYNPEFLSQQLSSDRIQKDLLKKQNKGAQGGVYLNTLSKIRLSVSSLDEQKKIAKFLSTVDEKIYIQSQKIAGFENLKCGFMQKIFSREMRFKDGMGGEFERWEKKILEMNFELVVDNRGKTPPLSDTGIPLIEISAVGGYNINYDKIEKHVSEEIYNTWFRQHLKMGDILFSTVGNTALCSYYDEKERCCIAQNIVGLRFNCDVDSRFMFYLLTETNNNRMIKSIEMNAVQPSIKVSQFIKLKFSLPTILEQKKIADFLSTFDKKIEIEKQILEKWQAVKKGLLQQMFV